MRTIAIIAGRELKSYLALPTAYLVTGIFLALNGAAFSMYLAGTSYSDTSIRGFLDAAPLLVLARKLENGRLAVVADGEQAAAAALDRRAVGGKAPAVDVGCKRRRRAACPPRRSAQPR